MWNCLEFCCMLYKNRIPWNLCCHFRWQTIFMCFYCNIYEMKPDIFEIFRTFSRYLGKKSGISGNIFGRFFLIFVSRPTPTLVSPRNKVWGAPRDSAILMTCHYKDLGRASYWSCHWGNLLQPIRGCYSDLYSDISSVWNYCSRSEVIRKGSSDYVAKYRLF